MTGATAPGPLRVALLLVSFYGVSAAISWSGASADLGGTSWRLVRFQGGDGTTLAPDDPAKYTIELGAEGQVSVRIDCNRGTATWRSEGPNQIELGPLALTRAVCPPAPLSDRLVEDWPSVRTYALREGHLFLSLAADGGHYELEPAGGAAAEGATAGAAGEPLEGTYWKLTHLGDAPVTVGFGQREPHLVLDAQARRFGGSGTCNQLAGSYELDGDHLTFGEMAGTLIACPQGMETEKAFLDALGRARAWKSVGRRLDLLDAAGEVVARFEARLVQ
jgi:heat shock protein HslJ